MRTVFLALIVCFAARESRAASPYGILLLAHGGDPRWNATVGGIARTLDGQAPTEVALGMADVQSMQAAVDKLQKRGAGEIVAVPLFVHSRSEVLDQTRYALGLRDQPSEVLRRAYEAMAHDPRMAEMHKMGMPHHMMTFSTERVRAQVPVRMSPGLDDSPIVADILYRRALILSREPALETVVLVAHGPVDDAANEAWLATMRQQGERLRAAGGYRDVVALTIRDDSRPEVKGKALQALRDAVSAAGEHGGRALVVPYLIARGGIESHLVEALRGLDYAWDDRTLCPDPAIELWAARAARDAAAR